MRRKRFRLINLAWITATVAGLVLSVAAEANADPGGWDPDAAGADQCWRSGGSACGR